jgi:hypothetical protein
MFCDVERSSPPSSKFAVAARPAFLAVRSAKHSP